MVRQIRSRRGNQLIHSSHSTYPPVKQRLLEQVGKSARLKVLNELKRTQGLAVGDLAERLKMSYMGVKDVCIDLEKQGLLDTWRHPQKIGRPQLLYRLTQRAHDLFPTTSNSATIDLLTAAQKLYGRQRRKAAARALSKRAEEYIARVKGESAIERARSLARVRDHDGYMAELEAGESGAARIVEHHSPILDLLRAYPLVAKLESDLFQRVLRAPVHREEETASGLYCATFHISGTNA
jgi:predicted ArsR family transcriptional regulator